MNHKRLVELAIWLLTAFFVVMMFGGLAMEIVHRLQSRAQVL